MKTTSALRTSAALTSLFSLTQAIAFGGARPTGGAILKPALTANPSSTVTSAPELSKAVLRPRAVGDNTCGYESGLPDGEYTCKNPSATCVYFTTAGVGARGCCTGSDYVNCGWLVDCIGLYDTASPKPTDSYTLQCTSSARPYCQYYTFPGLGVLDYGCGSTIDKTYRQILTTSNGQAARSSFAPLVSTGAIPIPNTSARVIGSDSTSTPTPSSSSSGGKKKKAPIGAIVGGVIGGLFFLGAAAAVIILVIVKGNKSKKAAAASAPAAAPLVANQQTGGTSPYAPPHTPQNEKDYVQAQTTPYYGDASQQQQQQQYHNHDGTLSPQQAIPGFGNDPRSMSPAPQYTGYVSPQPTGTTYVSPQPTGADGHVISEAGGQEVDRTAIPTQRNGEQVFEAPSGK